MKIFSADFETTTDENDCRVWAWGIVNIDDLNEYYIGNSIESFIYKISNMKGNNTFYFHNLKFDGNFIISYLLNNGFSYVEDRKNLSTKTFNILMGITGQFYCMDICTHQTDTYKKKIRILDSLKILPFSVEQIAKDFDIKEKKLTIDYNAYREIGHQLTKDEEEYLLHDIIIVAKALKKLFNEGMIKMTTGSNALHEYKSIMGGKFDKYFPCSSSYNKDIRESYKGGFTYLNPEFASKDIKEGIVLDVNSLYPSQMYYRYLPYGEGIFFTGEYQEDKLYNLYIQCFSCRFELKEGYLPTIQLKNDLLFNPIEYLKSSEGELITMSLTNVDMELFMEHYNVYDIEYHDGWKFKSSNILFREYIDKWIKIKIESTINKNKAMRAISKLMLNSLYGKFATAVVGYSKHPYLDNDGVVRFRVGEREEREGLYIPVATFITSWARYTTIKSAQKVKDRFIYADTDSLHLVGTDIPNELEISDTELGKWKIEKYFDRARFLRSKCYIEEVNGNLEVTCAGLPSHCHENVTWDNFHTGNEIPGKLKSCSVKGGIVLKNSPHKLR